MLYHRQGENIITPPTNEQHILDASKVENVAEKTGSSTINAIGTPTLGRPCKSLNTADWLSLDKLTLESPTETYVHSIAKHFRCKEIA